jgi:hypothetical protein
MATLPTSEPIYYEHECRTDADLITAELGTDSPRVPWVTWKQNYMFEFNRFYRIYEFFRLSMTSQIFGADCYLSTRYDSVHTRKESVVCRLYNRSALQMFLGANRMRTRQSGREPASIYFKVNSWHWLGTSREAKKNKFTLGCSAAKTNNVQKQVKLFFSLSATKLTRPEVSSVNSITVKQRTSKPETKTDI